MELGISGLTHGVPRRRTANRIGSRAVALAPANLEQARWPSRSRRVLLLMMGIVVLSVADLVITLTYLRAHWMMEANPIAAYLIKSTQSPWTLAAFKAFTVGVCVMLLYRARRYRVGEAAAWCAVAILAVMSVMWRSYATHFDDAEGILLAQAATIDDGRLGLP